MPPKVDVKTLTGKMNNAIGILYELMEEFETIFSVKPGLERLEAVFNLVESKYRFVKKQQESILDKLIEEGASSEDELVLTNRKLGDRAKADFLQIALKYAAYQNENSPPKVPDHTETLKTMTSAVEKMAVALGSKPSSLERLTVPNWDGSRRTYQTWKREFTHCMSKYGQDKDEQLQRFRKAMPKGFFWTDQVKTCKDIDQAWEILENEFANKRKIMDELLSEINKLKQVKRDTKSLARYATTISVYVNDMEDNGCSVLEASEAPFFMSQLLSKLDPRDNTNFGREMQRAGKEENVSNLITWLHEEATLRSRGKREPDNADDKEHTHRGATSRRTDNHAANNAGTSDEEACPLGCTSKHLLAACPLYQSSTINQRWDVVKQSKRCRKCLRPHHTNDCKKQDGTTCDKCRRNHHRSLHNETFYSNLNPNAASYRTHDSGEGNTNCTADRKKDFKLITGLCPVQKVKVMDSGGTLIEMLAMLDSGSNTSLLSKNAAQRLGISGTATHLTMNLAGGEKKSEASEVIEITVASTTEENIRKTLTVYTVKRPCSAAKTISKEAIEHFRHLKSVADDLHLSGGTIDLLIGTDFVDAFVDFHTLSGEPGEPIAKRNCFGWYVLGQVNSFRIQSVEVGTVSIEDDIKKLLYQDSLGVKPTKLCTCSENVLRENKFVKSLSDSTTLVGGRIQVRMPWNKNGPPKRSNYDIALKRMQSAEKSFQRKECFEIVDDEVQKLLQQEFVIKLPTDEVDHSQPEWYLPLQAVFTPERTTKVRLVFDSSSKGHDGLSLNDHLEKGPNYINSLPNVLIAWRWNEVAYSGDIRKMFNQVLVHPDDQVFHRFLWRSDRSESPSVFQWLRLNFGDKPAPDIATNAINYLAKVSQVEFPDAAQELRHHAYVDDIAGSKSNSTEAKKITKEIDTVLRKGQFQIKAWHSNCSEIDESNGERFTDLLGHKWDKEEDKFTFKKENVVGLLEGFSKRSCLKFLAQLWDPIGLVSPVTIKFRIDLQGLWSSGYSWDDILPESTQQTWLENIQSINDLLSFQFDRKLKPSGALGVPQIHGFSDGGEQAYGAVIFLRWKLAGGNYHCVPVMTKAFVAPLRKKSIPRLELLGCLALARMYDTCVKALEFTNAQDWERFFWVDSSTVLSWIRTPPREFRPFVSARVAEIQETIGANQIRYIKSNYNPADALTRGIDLNHLMKWSQGPSFLGLSEEKWPNFQDHTQNNTRVDDLEVLKEKKTFQKAGKHHSASVEVYPELDRPESEENPILLHLLKTCSTYSKIRRTLAYIRRFIHNARKINPKSGPISVQELKAAETHLLKWGQFHVDEESLDKKLVAKKGEDGIFRAHGRLEDVRYLPEDLRKPIILPQDHPFVNLLLRDLHERRGHCGYKSLIHEARKRFWIIGLRRMAKTVTSKCVICRKLRKRPLNQLMGQIPYLRVAAGFPAFSNTAMDMFGPVQIKLGRKTLKEAQVIIFACMTTRAVHLELVTDKTSDAFLMAFRRFACLRGYPSVCWSDHGTNFVGAQGYLKEVVQNWDVPKVKSVLSDYFGCEFRWEWNTPHASHQNGVVETLIKSVRQALNSTCKNQAYSEEQWRTFLSEITYMVNGRPLYPSSDDIWEAPPITPNDLIIGLHNPPPQPKPEERTNPRQLLRSTQNRVADFWRSWMKYFAPNLLPRNKWFRVRDNIQTGDLVLETDSKHKRCEWKMARIVGTYPGNDGLVRKVRIKTRDGEYDRPIHKLCLIATKEELNAGLF